MSTWNHLRGRTRTLLARRAFLVMVGLTLAATLGLWKMRLLGVLGFPNALALNILGGLFALGLGVMAGRMEHVITGPGQPRWLPLHLLPAKNPRRAVLGAWGAACVAAIVLLGLGMLVALGGGFVLGRCEILRGLPLYPVMVLPSLMLCTLVGVTLTLISGRWRVILPLLLLVISGSLLVTAWPVLAGPQAFVFNHFFGHVPGPLYDERIALSPALLAYRSLTLLWALSLAGLAFSLCDAPRFGLRSWQRHRGVHLMLVFSVIAGLTLTLARHRLGFEQSFASIEARLGGQTTIEGIVIHYPKERDARWVARTRADHAHARSALIAWLGLDPATVPVVRSYVFRSRQEKAALTGAGATSITKPWLDAIFIDDRAHPHPVLRHELAHALTAPWGEGLFRVAGGLIPNAGLVEGVAVAADQRADVLTLHAWARAMRESGVAPDIRTLFSARGFWSEGASRAYTLCGSFIRYLARTEGIGAVRRAYQAGTLAVLGPLEPRFAAWEAFIDAIPFDARARRLAEDRFRRPSILRRPCAFDVRALRNEAEAALGARDFEKARDDFARCAKLEPDDPGHLEGELRVAMAEAEFLAQAQGRKVNPKQAAPETPDLAVATARVESLTDRLLAHPKMSSSLASRIHARRGDAAWNAGDDRAADDHYARALALAARDDARRLLHVKRWAVANPAQATLLRPFLQGQLPTDDGILRLHEALVAASRDAQQAASTLRAVKGAQAEALLGYLLGRQLFNRRRWSHALRYLEMARDGVLPEIEGLAIENLQLIARARTELCWEKPGPEPRAEARAAWHAVATDPAASAAQRENAMDREARLGELKKN